MKEKPPISRKVVICGNYGAGNMGDELILKGILKMLAKVEGLEITVMSTDPEQTSALHGVKSCFLLPAGVRSHVRGLLQGGRKRTIRAIQDADLIIFGGGGLFNEEESRSFIIWGIQLAAFQRSKKPYVVFGQSFSMPKKELNKKIIQSCAEGAKGIIVRDEESKSVLQELGVTKKIKIGTDPAFYLSKEDFRDIEERPEGEKKILFCLREYATIVPEELNKKIVQFIENSKKKEGMHARLLPFQTGRKHSDGVLSEKLQLKAESPAFSPNAYWRSFQGAELVVGMRLHSIILAALTQTPFIALNYSGKVESMVKKLHADHQLINFPIDQEELEELYRKTRNELKLRQYEIAEAVEKEKKNAIWCGQTLKSILKKS